VLWAQGSIALTYLEQGDEATGATWDQIMQLISDEFLSYEIWSN